MAVAPEVMDALDQIVRGALAHDLESDVLEFKTDKKRSATDTVRDVAEAAACLANGLGGSTAHR